MEQNRERKPTNKEAWKHTHMQRHRQSQKNHKNTGLKTITYKQKTSKVKKNAQTKRNDTKINLQKYQ